MYNKTDYEAKKAAAQSALDAYIELVKKPDHTKAEEDTAADALKGAIDEYNKLVESDAYEALFLPENATEVGPLTDPAAHLKAVDPLGRAFRDMRFDGLMGKTFKHDKTGRIESGSLTYVASNAKDDKKRVFRLKDIEAKWDELQTAAKVAKKVPLMHETTWSATVLDKRELVKNLSLASANYAMPAGMTASSRVNIDGEAVEVADMTEDQKKKFTKKVTNAVLIEEFQKVVDAIYFDNTGRNNGSNKYRVVEADARWIRENAHNFSDNTYTTELITVLRAYSLAFCLCARVVTKKGYKCTIGE